MKYLKEDIFLAQHLLSDIEFQSDFSHRALNIEDLFSDKCQNQSYDNSLSQSEKTRMIPQLKLLKSQDELKWMKKSSNNLNQDFQPLRQNQFIKTVFYEQSLAISFPQNQGNFVCLTQTQYPTLSYQNPQANLNSLIPQNQRHENIDVSALMKNSKTKKITKNQRNLKAPRSIKNLQPQSDESSDSEDQNQSITQTGNLSSQNLAIQARTSNNASKKANRSFKKILMKILLAHGYSKNNFKTYLQEFNKEIKLSKTVYAPALYQAMTHMLKEKPKKRLNIQSLQKLIINQIDLQIGKSQLQAKFQSPKYFFKKSINDQHCKYMKKLLDCLQTLFTCQNDITQEFLEQSLRKILQQKGKYMQDSKQMFFRAQKRVLKLIQKLNE